MIYFKSIASRLTNNKDLLSTINEMDNDKAIFKVLTENVDSNKVIDVFEQHYGVNFINLNQYKVDPSILNGFEIKRFKKLNIIPFSFDNEEYSIALNDFMDKSIINSIKRALQQKGFRAKFYFAFEEDIRRGYSSIEKVEPIVAEVSESLTAIEWINTLLIDGIRLNASDIHIERLENGLQTRYRIDGVLTHKKVYNYSDDYISGIFVRLKVISNMDISEKRRPQDGRINDYEIEGALYDLRVSTVSLIHGEKAVMRIFDKNEGFRSYEEIGFSEKQTTKTKKMLENNSGLIYLSGATGSGKTTTLYTMIDTLNKDDVNIYTIENPVERTIKNVNQIQIDEVSGISYPTTLRALLRQDPDVIVVGEIRDTETASLSVRASLTGHLVLSTLHANSALDSVSRLLDMEIKPYLISASSLGFVAQRLVRVLCPHCKEKVNKLSVRERVWLDSVIEENDLDDVEDNQLYMAKGCSHCNNGYKGRIALVEIIEATDKIKQLITSDGSVEKIKEQALKDGYSPIIVEGLNAALEGKTSIDELIRETN